MLVLHEVRGHETVINVDELRPGCMYTLTERSEHPDTGSVVLCVSVCKHPRAGRHIEVCWMIRNEVRTLTYEQQTTVALRSVQ